MKTMFMLVRANLAERAPRPGDTTLRAGQYDLDRYGTYPGAGTSLWMRIRSGVSF